MKIQISSLLLSLVLAFTFGTAWAGDVRSYSDEVFAELKAEGGPVLVDITASWCGTCKKQQAILAELLTDAEFSEYTVVRVDWDAQREVATGVFGAPRQSALSVYRGEELRGRSLGDTSVDGIRTLLEKGLDD